MASEPRPVQPRLRSMGRHTWLLLVLPLSLAGCTGGDTLRQAGPDRTPPASPSPTISPDVPEEFRPACGRPGSQVVTDRLEVRIKHSDCDLTGVTIVNQGRGAAVPEPGIGVGNSSGVTIEVDEQTGDVTFRAEAEVPQY